MPVPCPTLRQCGTGRELGAKPVSPIADNKQSVDVGNERSSRNRASIVKANIDVDRER